MTCYTERTGFSLQVSAYYVNSSGGCEQSGKRRAGEVESRKVNRSWALTQIEQIFELIILYLMAKMGISQHLKPAPTFQLEQEAETSIDPPLGQRSVCSWSYSSPLEGWSSLWSDTCMFTTHSSAKVYQRRIVTKMRLDSEHRFWEKHDINKIVKNETDRHPNWYIYWERSKLHQFDQFHLYILNILTKFGQRYVDSSV